MNEEIVAPAGLPPEQQIGWILAELRKQRGNKRPATSAPAASRLPGIEGPWANFAEFGEELSK